MASGNFDSSDEFAWDSSVYALMHTQEYLEAGQNIVELDDDTVMDSYLPG